MSSNRCTCQTAQPPTYVYFRQMVELATIRIFLEHSIFKAIPADGILLSELSQKVDMEYNLLKRFSEFLIAAQVISAPTPDYITLTPVSEEFQKPFNSLFYTYLFDSFMHPATKWPKYFSLNGLREPQSCYGSPYGLATGHPDKSFYELLETDPKRASLFNDTMALAVDDMPITGIYDFSWVVEYSRQPGAAGRTLLVDVGGGKGQALTAILNENPGLPGASCVLQDRAGVIEETQESTGVLKAVNKVASNFFDEQPTKGALIYYIRRVLNDWPDDQCVTILENIREACAMDSRVLINENFLPDEPSVFIAAVDLFLMNFGGKRRNKKMFSEIATRAGFKVTRIIEDKPTNSAVVELAPIELVSA